MSRRGAILQDYGGRFEPMPQDAQLAAAQYYQRDKEQNKDLAYKKGRDAEQAKKDAEADKYRKLKMIDDATDPTGYQSSTQKANSLATQQLLGVRNEFAGKTDLPPDQLYLQLQQKLTPVAQGYNSYKADLTGQEALAKKAVEVNPNLDMQKILVDLQKQVDSHHLVTNPDGTNNFNQATIGTDSNALQEILKPENAWKYSKGTKPLIDAVKGKGTEAELFSQGTDGSQINYKAKVPEWAQLVDSKGNIIEADPKTGLIPKGEKPRLVLKGTVQDYQETDESGKPLVDRQGNPVISKMIVVPQSTMNKILSNDETEYAFEGDWQKHKQLANIDVDPAHEQDLKRIYFSQWLADNGLSQPYVSARTHLPPQPRNITNIHVNNGKPPVPVMDIVTPVKSYFDNVGEQKEGLKGVAQLNLFNNEVTTPVMNEVKVRYPDVTADDIYYQKEGDNIWVMKADESGKVNRNKDVPVFKLDEFTNVSGNKPQGVKSKNEALRQAQSGKPETKTATGYTNVQTLQDSKGKTIQAGVKNGKWYDIKTGKPIE